MAESTKEKMNSSSEYVPSPWSRRTVADGAWMQKYTIAKLSARDNYLADQLDENVITISGDINTIDNKVETVSGDLNTVSSKLENMSPLTYKGNNNVSSIKKDLTGSNVRNGDVYSITAISQSKAMPSSGYWWYGGTTKSGDNDFKVKKNDEVAYTSAGNKWFPIGQDYHVEYSAGQFIEVDNDNYTIAISGCKPVVFENPLRKIYDDTNDRYVIKAELNDFTAQKFNVINSITPTPQGLVYYNNEKLYYNTNIIEKDNGISATTITASTAIGTASNFTTGTFNKVTATAISGRGLTISGNIVNNLDNNETKNLILYYKNCVKDSTYNTDGTPKIVWSGENDNKDAIGALAFSYYDTPSRFGTEISTANSYTNTNNPGGWFDFTLIDGSNTRAGVLADTFSSTTMRTSDISATTFKTTNISATKITADGPNYFGKNTVFGVNNKNDDSTYNILWTDVVTTANTKLWYTDSAFKVNPKSGMITTPILSSTKLTAETAIGESAKFTNISGGNATAAKLYLTSNGDACGNAAGDPMIRLGTTGNTHMEIDGNEIFVKSAGKNDTLDRLYLNINDGKTGSISMGNVSANTVSCTSLTANKYNMTNWNNSNAEFNLMWTNSANGSLYYTNTAFKVQPKAGKIVTPAISSTNITANNINGTAIGNFVRGNGSITAIQTATQVGTATGILYLI